ncbi:MAG: hypothetical protein ACI9J2_002426, partial [Saprospiraceae bacterium]
MTSESPDANGSQFDPYDKEKQLRAESNTWDTSAPEMALASDIPVI